MGLAQDDLYQICLDEEEQPDTFYMSIWDWNAWGFITLDSDPELTDYQDLPPGPIDLM